MFWLTNTTTNLLSKETVCVSAAAYAQAKARTEKMIRGTFMIVWVVCQKSSRMAMGFDPAHQNTSGFYMSQPKRDIPHAHTKRIPTKSVLSCLYVQHCPRPLNY
jgi:hypothetical protein